ncbi:MAG TPA: PqqD family protein [Jatrophihabitantaceae bacterium]|jgi:hypothetical protein
MPEDAVPAQLALRPDDLKWTATDEGVTVLDLRTARYLQLNRSGALLWERLSVGASVDELGEALVQRFGIDLDRARHDVNEFVSALRERGFLSAE